MGADYRKIGVDLYNPGNSSGNFKFGRELTSSTGLANGDVLNGNAMASFLLGLPNGDFQSTPSTFTLTTPLNIYTNYFGGYVQDDWRVSSKFTVNYGLRVEHEDGMREENNNFTVGFDRTSTNGLSSVVIPASVDPSGGTPAHSPVGGLMYAGVNGNPTQQGNPPKAKWSPRLGAVYSLDSEDRAARRLRPLLGAVELSGAEPDVEQRQLRPDRLHQQHLVAAAGRHGIPTVTLANPFPNGVVPASGSSLGLLAGAGTNIRVRRSEPRRAARAAVLGGPAARAAGQHGGHGQLRRRARRPSAARRHGGHAGQHQPARSEITCRWAHGAEHSRSPTRSSASRAPVRSPRRRPSRAASCCGRSRSSATSTCCRSPKATTATTPAVFELNKRLSHGWGGRFSYTYSVLKDNQMGETNFYSNRGNTTPVNNYNFMAVANNGTAAAACQAGQQNTTTCFDPSSEYCYGILDVPHRFIVAPIFQLPFGKDHKIGKSAIGNAMAGGWMLAAVFNFQSGFPIGVLQSNSGTNLLGNALRPNLATGLT